MTFRDSVQGHVESAIASTADVARAREFLKQEIARRRFNMERAVEVFMIAVDNAFWASCKDVPVVGRKMYADYKAMGLGLENAQRLTRDFIEETGARDQRPSRRFLRGLLGA
jgi:hypothetical protein